MELQQGQQSGVTAVLVLGSCAWRQLSLAAAFSLNEVLSQPSVTINLLQTIRPAAASTAAEAQHMCCSALLPLQPLTVRVETPDMWLFSMGRIMLPTSTWATTDPSSGVPLQLQPRKDTGCSTLLVALEQLAAR